MEYSIIQRNNWAKVLLCGRIFHSTPLQPCEFCGLSHLWVIHLDLKISINPYNFSDPLAPQLHIAGVFQSKPFFFCIRLLCTCTFVQPLSNVLLSSTYWWNRFIFVNRFAALLIRMHRLGPVLLPRQHAHLWFKLFSLSSFSSHLKRLLLSATD
jgi:hypothetical protein